MSIIYIMIPLALVLVAVAIVAMIWAVRTGQFDELESHGWTPVLDDDERPVGGSVEGAVENRVAEGAEARQEHDAEESVGDGVRNEREAAGRSAGDERPERQSPGTGERP